MLLASRQGEKDIADHYLMRTEWDVAIFTMSGQSAALGLPNLANVAAVVMTKPAAENVKDSEVGRNLSMS